MKTMRSIFAVLLAVAILVLAGCAAKPEDKKENIQNSIAVGYGHTLGLKSDGTMVAIGFNDDGQRNVQEWSDIVAFSGGAYHTVGLKKDGTVVAAGDNIYGQCDIDKWTDILVK